MCYTVVVAKKTCNYRHPKADSGVLCWRQCATQSSTSKETGDWDRLCDNQARNARVIITDAADRTVSRDECTICQAFRNDAELARLKDLKDEKRIEIENLDRTLRSRTIERTAQQMRELQNRIFAEGRILVGIEESIINRQERIRLDSENTLRNEAERAQPSSELSYYFSATVSSLEKSARRAIRYPADCPKYFPRRRDAVWRHLDRYKILDGDIDLDAD